MAIRERDVIVGGPWTLLAASVAVRLLNTAITLVAVLIGARVIIGWIR